MSSIRFFLTVFVFAAPVFASPLAWAEAEADDEFDFLEQGEANRAANEADRAPSGNIFLDDEDEDEEMEQWAVPTKVAADQPMEDDPDEGYEMDEPDTPAFGGLEELSNEDPVEAGDGSMFGMTPFSDNYPLKVVQRDGATVVVELPVLVAKNNAGFQNVWIVADVIVDGHTVAQSRQYVTQAAVSDFGPTHVWVKTAVPIEGPEAMVEVHISRAATSGGRTEPLFSRSVPVRM